MMWVAREGVDLGWLPGLLDDADARPAREQIDDRYRYGGGWHDFPGFTLHDDLSLSYPGDQPLKPLAKTCLRQETIYLYPHGWLLILQPDGSYVVARVD